MQSDLRDSLVSAYPGLFEVLGTDGIEIGDGWFVLIWNLCRAMENRLSPAVPVHFDRMGVNRSRLQIDVPGGDQGAIALIDFAIRMSGSVCEYCGAPGRSTKSENGWSVSCVECKSLSDSQRRDRFQHLSGPAVRQLISAAVTQKRRRGTG